MRYVPNTYPNLVLRDDRKLGIDSGPRLRHQQHGARRRRRRLLPLRRRPLAVLGGAHRSCDLHRRWRAREFPRAASVRPKVTEPRVTGGRPEAAGDVNTPSAPKPQARAAARVRVNGARAGTLTKPQPPAAGGSACRGRGASGVAAGADRARRRLRLCAHGAVRLRRRGARQLPTLDDACARRQPAAVSCQPNHVVTQSVAICEGCRCRGSVLFRRQWAWHVAARWAPSAALPFRMTRTRHRAVRHNASAHDPHACEPHHGGR